MPAAPTTVMSASEATILDRVPAAAEGEITNAPFMVAWMNPLLTVPASPPTTCAA